MPERPPRTRTARTRTTPQSLARHVLLRLRGRCGVARGDRLLVGVSGGADSVALLRLLVDIAPRQGLHLEVAHFDHALRPDSQDDARFVVDLAREHGLEAHAGRWMSPVRGEDAARRARHVFLEATAARRASSALTLGQHLDDQVETILLRLGRGTGLRGWLGMAWRRPGPVPIVRPLLDLRRSVLVDYLRSLGQPWREDPTNRDLGPARNRVRHVAVPALEQALGAGWDDRWLDGLEDLRAVWNWLETGAARLLDAARLRSRHPEGGIESCTLAALRLAPEPMLHAALQLWIESRAVRDLSRRHIDAAAQLIRNGQSGQALDLPNGLRLVLEQDRITLMPRGGRLGGEMAGPEPRIPGSTGPESERTTPETAEPPARSYDHPPADEASQGQLDRAAKGAPIWNLEVLDMAGAAAWTEISRRAGAGQRAGAPPPAERLPEGAETLVALDGLVPPFEVRLPLPGDRVRLLGAPGAKKLYRALQDRHVPRRLRAAWPLVADREGIIWVAGLEIAERARLTPTTLRAARLRLVLGPPRLHNSARQRKLEV